VVRGEDTKENDIDILVEIKERMNLLVYLHIK
jgi:predicted nucleotidyltransferase